MRSKLLYISLIAVGMLLTLALLGTTGLSTSDKDNSVHIVVKDANGHSWCTNEDKVPSGGNLALVNQECISPQQSSACCKAFGGIWKCQIRLGRVFCACLNITG